MKIRNSIHISQEISKGRYCLTVAGEAASRSIGSKIKFVVGDS